MGSSRVKVSPALILAGIALWFTGFFTALVMLHDQPPVGCF
jgi:hypothetical protein